MFIGAPSVLSASAIKEVPHPDFVISMIGMISSPYVKFYDKNRSVLPSPDVMPSNYCVAADFSLDGRYLAIGLSGGVIVYDISTETMVGTVLSGLPAGVGECTGVRFSRNSKRLAVCASSHNVATIYNVPSFSVLTTINFGVPVRYADWNADDSILVISSAGAVSSPNKTVRLYNTTSFSELTGIGLTGLSDQASAGCVFSPDGNILAVYFTSVGLRLWGGLSFNLLSNPTGSPTDASLAVQSNMKWSRSGKYLAWQTQNQSFHVFERTGTTSFTKRATLTVGAGDNVRAHYFFEDDNKLLLAKQQVPRILEYTTSNWSLTTSSPPETTDSAIFAFEHALEIEE